VRRRDFIELAALVGAAPAALAASKVRASSHMRRLGVFLPMTKNSAERYMVVVRQELAARGFVEGRNLRIDERFVPYGAQQNVEVARELVALKPDVLITGSTLVTVAAQRASAAVPVIFAWVADPIAAGIVSDYARPGRNATGVTNRFFEITAKRVELMRELLPGAKRIAMVTGVFDEVLEAAMIPAEKMAGQLGLTLVRAPTQGGWDNVGAVAAGAQAQGAIVLTPFGILGLHDTASATARQMNARRIPATFSEIESVEQGGLMSYATNLSDDIRKAAGMAAQVLRGAHPADLPVDQAARFELGVNLKTAREIGLLVPQSLLLRADRVIE
jgi:putative ABC transport system substrate-binding protein